jgi:hypothetical protein
MRKTLPCHVLCALQTVGFVRLIVADWPRRSHQVQIHLRAALYTMGAVVNPAIAAQLAEPDARLSGTLYVGFARAARLR